VVRINDIDVQFNNNWSICDVSGHPDLANQLRGHISKLQTLRKSANEMCMKSRSKSKETPQTTEEIAIDLLKSLGCRISKPQLLIEEAMKNPEKPVSEFIQYIRI